MLPPLTKEHIQLEPLPDRIFSTLAEVDHLRATSGTSGKPPLLYPRTPLQGLDHRVSYYDFSGATLSYTVPIMPHWHEQFIRDLGKIPRVVIFDPRRPRGSLKLAKAQGVDHICLFTFHMPVVCDLMEEEHMGEGIKLIEIAGETCSNALFHRMRKTFPNAKIFSYYGASEVEDWPIGMACQPLSEDDPSGVYHEKETQYLEIINPETGVIIEPVAGVEGDLLISAFPKPPRAFPLIRYRIGDRIRIVGKCREHTQWSFIVLGRSESDFIKIPGGILRADEIERVLRSMSDRTSDHFELHRYDRETKDGVQVEVVLYVDVKEGVSLDEVARDVARLLRVNPVRTYEEGVRDGMYLPLVCLPIEMNMEVKKRKRMVHHS